MKFFIFQINLSQDQVEMVNSSRERPEFYARYLATKIKPTAEVIMDARSQYRKVALIVAKDWDQVFEIGNIGPIERIVKFGPMHSVSVGDVIVREDGVCKFVDSVGFGDVDFLEVTT